MQPESKEKHNKKISLRVTLTGMLCNLLLFGGKLFFFLFTGAASLLADSLNNLSDFMNQIFAVISINISSRPADKEHPYGHARFEYISTTLLSFVIILMGFSVLKGGVLALLYGSERFLFSLESIVFMVISIGVKVFMGFMYRKNGKKLDSPLLLANAADSFNDVFASSAVILSAVLFTAFKINIDAYVSIIVSLFILSDGVQILWNTGQRIIGRSQDQKLMKEIIEKVMEYPFVFSAHDLMLHEYGPGRIFASLHVEVNGGEKLSSIHPKIDRIEREVGEYFKIHLLIHMDPREELMGEEKIAYRAVLGAIQAVNPRMNSHDPQFDRTDNGRLRLSIDITVPDDEKRKEADLSRLILEEMQKEGVNTELRIDFDRAYQTPDLDG